MKRIRLWPVISVSVGLSLALCSCEKPARTGEYMSRARVELTKAGTQPSGDDDGFRTVQMELIQSGEIRRRAHKRLQATHPGLAAISVAIKVSRMGDSDVLNIMGTASDPEYVRAYVDAVVDEYLQFLDELADDPASTTMNNIGNEVIRLERELKEKQKALEEFRKKSDVPLLESRNRKYEASIAELRLRIADLEVARKAGDADKKAVDANIAEIEKEIADYVEKNGALREEMRTLRKLESEVERLRVPYATLRDTLGEIDNDPLKEVVPVSILERATVAVPSR